MNDVIRSCSLELFPRPVPPGRPNRAYPVCLCPLNVLLAVADHQCGVGGDRLFAERPSDQRTLGVVKLIQLRAVYRSEVLRQVEVLKDAAREDRWLRCDERDLEALAGKGGEGRWNLRVDAVL